MLKDKWYYTKTYDILAKREGTTRVTLKAIVTESIYDKVIKLLEMHECPMQRKE